MDPALPPPTPRSPMPRPSAPRAAAHRTLRQRIRRWAVVALVLGAVCLGAAWLAFQHIPTWYKPTRVRAAEVDRIRNNFSNQYDRFSTALNAAKGPFQYWVTLEQLNEWLAIREEIWPLSRHWLHGNLSDPCVLFEEGAIRLAATYRSGSLATIVSARLLVDGRADGIWVRLDNIQLGSLPLPVSAVREYLERLSAGPWPAGTVSRHQNLRERLPPLTDLLTPEGMRLPNSFIWVNPKRPFWIYELKVEPDAIVASIEAVFDARGH